jgi:general secretion pathway protein G
MDNLMNKIKKSCMIDTIICNISKMINLKFPHNHLIWKNRGFTLVEVLITVVVIGILSAIALPAYKNFKKDTRVGRAASEIRVLEKAIYTFASDNLTLPNNLNQLITYKYLPTNFNDPWGAPYQYYLIPHDLSGAYQFWGGDGNLNHDFDLYCTGADIASAKNIVPPPGQNTSSDDIVRAGEGSFVTLAVDY